MKKLFTSKFLKIIAPLALVIAIIITPLFSVYNRAAYADTGTFTEFPVSSTGSTPDGITFGIDGNFWFTDFDANKIGRITPTGDVTEFSIPTPNSQPNRIASGSDGNLWFTETNVNKIGRITTSGDITEFSLPDTNYAEVYDITGGPDGNLWFTEIVANKVGRITLAGDITEFSLPTADSAPYNITGGSDGNLWVTEFSANQIARITPVGEITEFPIPSFGHPYGITDGPDGNLWFTKNSIDGNKIGKITTFGEVTEFPIPNVSGGPFEITSGIDGNLWFTEPVENKIERITTTGVVTEYPIPTVSSDPQDIIADFSGNLWFTEIGAGQIGRLNPSGAVPSPTPSPTSFPTPTPVPGSQAYVALGDSYSSGWGVQPYFDANTSCERSIYAYPTLVKMPNSGVTFYDLRDTLAVDWGFLACGGNTTKDVLNDQLSGKIDRNNDNYLGLTSATTLVTITVGGDDLEFSKVLEFCYANRTNCSSDIYKDGMTLDTWLTNAINALGAKLQNVYHKIHDQAPNARILVLGYPQIFPASSDEQNCTQLRQSVSFNGKSIGFSQPEQNFIRGKAAQLNNAISLAVADTHASGVDSISFVPVADTFAGHEVCGNSGQWIDGVSGTFARDWPPVKAKDFVFHPSMEGQQQYANIINNYLMVNP